MVVVVVDLGFEEVELDELEEVELTETVLRVFVFVVRSAFGFGRWSRFHHGSRVGLGEVVVEETVLVVLVVVVVVVEVLLPLLAVGLAVVVVAGVLFFDFAFAFEPRLFHHFLCTGWFEVI